MKPPDAVATAAPPEAASGSLASRLLACLRLEATGAPDRQQLLERAVRRMLDSPTARDLAEQFIADGTMAEVGFAPVGAPERRRGARRPTLGAPRALSRWNGTKAIVTLNPDYLAVDEEFRDGDLPPTLGHELLGHALWSGRAQRAGLFQAVHHHELNEVHARLVGWLIDLELDGRIQPSGARQYFDDPYSFRIDLKFLDSYYALTFSHDELAQPLETMQGRLAVALERRAALEASLARHVSWYAVMTHFVGAHGVAAERFAALRDSMHEEEAHLQDQIAVLEQVTAVLADTLARCHAEPDQRSVQYFRQSAAHELLSQLQAEVQRRDRQFRRQVDACIETPFASEEGDGLPPVAGGTQVTFEELLRMCDRDRLDHPEHWREV